MTEDAITLFELLGEKIYFSFGFLMALPSVETLSVPSTAGFYELDETQYQWHLRTEDVENYNIFRGTKFYYFFASRKYFFEVLSSADDMTGISTLKTRLLEVENV